jgi:hypothetical protein
VRRRTAPSAIHPPEMGSIVAVPQVGGLHRYEDGLSEKPQIEDHSAIGVCINTDTIPSKTMRDSRFGGSRGPWLVQYVQHYKR